MDDHRRGGVAAFFDLDRTLLPGSSLYPLARALRRSGYVGTFGLLRLGAGQARFRILGREADRLIAKTRKASLLAIRGRSRDALIDLARTVVRDIVLDRVYPRGVALIAAHRDAGHAVFLASSSPQDYVDVLAEALRMDGAVGTRAEAVDGTYTGELDGPLVHGRHKAHRVAALAAERRLELAGSFAYSDSINDLPLLGRVGNPVAVNPDRALAAEARRREWPILDFRVGRPLRTYPLAAPPAPVAKTHLSGPA
jgi:HAD superfamily hydrolase (TIGR01490 family)